MEQKKDSTNELIRAKYKCNKLIDEVAAREAKLQEKDNVLQTSRETIYSQEEKIQMLITEKEELLKNMIAETTMEKVKKEKVEIRKAMTSKLLEYLVECIFKSINLIKIVFVIIVTSIGLTVLVNETMRLQIVEMLKGIF